jgi:hypothetical protein
MLVNAVKCRLLPQGIQLGQFRLTGCDYQLADALMSNPVRLAIAVKHLPAPHAEPGL